MKDGKGRQIIGTARTCTIVLDVNKPLTHRYKIRRSSTASAFASTRSPAHQVCEEAQGKLSARTARWTSRSCAPREYKICCRHQHSAQLHWDQPSTSSRGTRVHALPLRPQQDRLDPPEELDLLTEVPHYVPVSAEHEEFRCAANIWEYAKMMRIYTAQGPDPRLQRACHSAREAAIRRNLLQPFAQGDSTEVQVRLGLGRIRQAPAAGGKRSHPRGRGRRAARQGEGAT